jgi:hypothetical protein
MHWRDAMLATTLGGAAACAWSNPSNSPTSTNDAGGDTTASFPDAQTDAPQEAATDGGLAVSDASKEADAGLVDGGDGGQDASANVVATGTNVGIVLVDDTYLYWLEAGDAPEGGPARLAFVKRVAKAGGPPTILAASPAAPPEDDIARFAALGLDDSYLYYVQTTGPAFNTFPATFYAMPKGGTGARAIATVQIVETMAGRPIRLAVTSDDLSWWGQNYDNSGHGGSVPQQFIALVPKTGDGGVAKIQEVQVPGAPLLAYTARPDSVYYVGQTDWTVSQVALDGGSTLVAAAQAVPSALASDDASVYWAASGVGLIVSAPLDAEADAALTTIVDGGAQAVQQLQLNASSLVWTDGTAIWKAPRSGGAATQVAADVRIVSFSVDDANVYWTNGAEIRRGAL